MLLFCFVSSVVNVTGFVISVGLVSTQLAVSYTLQVFVDVN